MSEPTTLHASFSATPRTDAKACHISVDRANCLTVWPNADGGFVDIGFARQLESEVEQMRLNGCEAVRRSEEAANSDRQVLAAVTQGLRTEFQEGDTWDETDLLENWEVFFAHHKDVEDKLAVETALVNQARVSMQLGDRPFEPAMAEFMRVFYQRTDEMFAFKRERDALVKQVTVLREALKEVRDDHNFGHLREGACDLVDKAIAATPASASAEDNKEGHRQIDLLKATIENDRHQALLKELAAAREDTARLKWAMDRPDLFAVIIELKWASDAKENERKWRAAIDAARNATP